MLFGVLNININQSLSKKSKQSPVVHWLALWFRNCNRNCIVKINNIEIDRLYYTKFPGVCN